MLLGGLVQINPIWLWGPFHTYVSTNGAQPDWYLGWLIGALRLMPASTVTIGHYTLVPNPFWGGVLFPLRRVRRSSPVAVARAAAHRRPRASTTSPTARATRRCGPRSAFGVLTWVVR